MRGQCMHATVSEEGFKLFSSTVSLLFHVSCELLAGLMIGHLTSSNHDRLSTPTPRHPHITLSTYRRNTHVVIAKIVLPK